MKVNDKDNLPYLSDILNAIDTIEVYMQDAPNEAEFVESGGLYQDAVVRNLEIIGEAASKITGDFRKKYPQIPWRDVSDMRNKLIHEYGSVDWSLVWVAATEEIKSLKEEVLSIIANEQKD